MNEINNSRLLAFIIDRAKQAPGSSVGLTASRYLLSLLEVYVGATEYRLMPEERGKLQAILERCLPPKDRNYEGVREFLSASIAGKVNETPADAEFMQKRISQAKMVSQLKAEPELSADAVLELIFKAPDKAVRRCIEFNLSAESQLETEPAPQRPTPAAGDRPKAPEAAPAAPATPEQTQKEAVAALTERVKQTQRTLSREIFGQDKAISVFTTGYFQAEMRVLTDSERKKPRATFLFAGPPGVGKTFLAEKAAETLGLPFMRFDMSEYSDKEAPLEFIGSDKVYKNAKEGNVTGFVAKNPHCILLFDEIEKAHLNIIHLFLQMLDVGRLRDSFTDKEVSFKDTIIIFTTNAGRKLYEESEQTDFSTVTRKVILKALQQDSNPETGAAFFPAAMCSRFATGNVVMFNYITAHNLREIAKKQILRHVEAFEQKIGIKVNIDEQVYTALLFSEGGAADARTISSRAEAFFDQELFELFRLVDAGKVSSSIQDIEEISITVELPQGNPEITALFRNTERPEVMLVASQQVLAACSEACDRAEFLPAQTVPEAQKILRNRNVSFILLDLNFKRSTTSSYLNIEDVASTARDLFWYVHQHFAGVPVYLLQTGTATLSEEEITSFLQMGVRGVISLSENNEGFAEAVGETCEIIHQQVSMNNLAKANRLVTFETAQSIFDLGRKAEIKLFDFEMEVAVEAGDEKNILSSVSKPNVSFDQVIGAGDAKKELLYFVQYLKDPKRYLGTGVSAPKGVLLYGPPGTGKTMLAKATASESDVTFIAAEGNQFMKRYVGEGPEAVHELFRTARKYAPAIIFIDEIDAIGKNRAGDENTHTGDILTAFLTEMDGFRCDPTRPIFVLAATNFDVEPGSRSLDPALLRRFDRRILVDVPNRDDRIRYLRMRMEQHPMLELSEDKINNIAIRSTGMSLADMASVIELALRTAIRDGQTKVTDEIFEEAFETFSSGEVKHWDTELLERVARHEAGHAFLCWQSGETPSYLTIVARGSHGGYMQHDDNEGKAIHTRRELLERLRTSMGGRAAEIVYYGEEEGLSSGASGDLRNATHIARSILCSYGMDREFGLSYVDQQTAKEGGLSERIHAAVNKILEEELRNAVRLISEHRAAIDALVQELMVRNHMSGPEIDAILRRSV